MFRTASIFGVFCLFAGSCAALTAAQADEKIVQATTVHSPALQAAMNQMSPEERAKMAEMGMSGTQTTISYFAGGLARIDMGNRSLISDGSKQIQVTVDRASHTYTVRRKMSPAVAEPMKGMSVSARPTGDKKVILGHRSSHYVLTMTVADPRGGASVINGSVWVAPDIIEPNIADVATGPGGMLLAALKKIKGIPLELSLAVHSESSGNFTISTITKSISLGRLPSSVFAIPAGYKQTVPGAGVLMPGATNRP